MKRDRGRLWNVDVSMAVEHMKAHARMTALLHRRYDATQHGGLAHAAIGKHPDVGIRNAARLPADLCPVDDVSAPFDTQSNILCLSDFDLGAAAERVRSFHLRAGRASTIGKAGISFAVSHVHASSVLSSIRS